MTALKGRRFSSERKKKKKAVISAKKKKKKKDGFLAGKKKSSATPEMGKRILRGGKRESVSKKGNGCQKRGKKRVPTNLSGGRSVEVSVFSWREVVGNNCRGGRGETQ